MASKDLVVRLIGDTSKFGKALKGAEHDLSRVGAKMTKTITPAAAAVAVGMSRIGSSWNDARDAIVRGTGATGKALDDLMGSTRRVAGRVPQDFGTVGQAIADVNTRLGLTGSELEDVAKQALDFARVTGVDVSSAVRTTARAMQDWGVEASEAGSVMDMFAAASQQTGIDVTRLGDTLVQFGAPLRQIGFSMEEATALLAGFEAQGVNTEAVMSGLRQSLGRMARAGEDPIATFQRVTEAIKNAGSQAEANRMAVELFGQRAGPDMAAAIREGRFEIDDLVASLNDSEGTVDSASQATLRLSDRFAMLRNRVTGVLGPFGEIGGAIAGVAAGAGPLIFGLGQMVPLLGKVRAAMVALATAMRAHPILALAGVITGVVGAFVAFGRGASDSRERVDELARSMRDAGDAGEGLRRFLLSMLEDAPDVVAAMDRAGLSFDDLHEAVMGGDESFATFQQRVADAGEAMGLSNVEIIKLLGSLGNLAVEFDQATNETEAFERVAGDAARASSGLAGELDDLGDAANDVERDSKSLTAAQLALQGGLKGAAQATGEAEEAARSYRQELVNSLPGIFSHEEQVHRLELSYGSYKQRAEETAEFLNSDASTEDKERALRELRLEQLRLVADLAKVAESYAEEQGAVKGSQEQIDIMIGKLEEQREKYPELADEIDTYIEHLRSVPAEVVTTPRVDTSSALSAIQNLRNQLGGLRVGDINAPRVDDRFRATGTPFDRGSVIVGEHGVERVNLPAGSSIDPHWKTAESMRSRSGGGALVHIEHAEFNGGTDGEMVANELVFALAGVLP